MNKKTRWNLLLLFFMLITYSSCRSEEERQPTGPTECREGHWAMKKFAESYGNAHSLKLINVGHSFELYPKTIFSLWMADFSPKTLEAGRIGAVDFLHAFWAEIQKNPKTVALFDYECRFDPKRYSPPMSLKHVMFKIAFWDKDVNRQKAPYLAEIVFYDNKFYYYQANPTTNALQLVLEESYEEAVAKSQPPKASPRIVALLPGLLFPLAVEPAIPGDFIAMSPDGSSDLYDWVYWGPKDVLEAYFKNPQSLKTPILRVKLSDDVAQTGPNSFSDIGIEEMKRKYQKDFSSHELKWGNYPVLTLQAPVQNKTMYAAWVGLNDSYGGWTLMFSLVYPDQEGHPNKLDSALWENFLSGTKSLSQCKTDSH